MRLSIMFKSTAVLILSILIGALGIFLTSRHFMHDGFDHTIEKELQIVRNVVDDTYANTKKTLQKEAKMAASSEEMRHAFQSNDPATFDKYAKELLRECEVNFVMIIDEKGTVLARGHSEKKGDNFSEFDIVRVALHGQSLSEAVDLKQSGLSVGAASPILINGKQVGIVLLGNAFRNSIVSCCWCVYGLCWVWGLGLSRPILD